ncbi:uncharacterized protein V6R79_006664 [Siganus canaliculatus]
MIKISNPKEHPYSSHISKFAVFPSFRSPDDPETGVRASSQTFPNQLMPSSAPAVTVLSKTIGGPYRHELLESAMGNRKKPCGWAGEDVLREKNQVFYPTPPKMMLPNAKLRSWDLTLSERTSNMLKNLEKSHWITSYQLHYTAHGCEKPRDVKHKQRNESKSFAYESTERENGKVQLNQSAVELSVSHSSQETSAAQMAGTQRPLDMSSRPLPQREMEASGEKRMTELYLKDEPSHKKEYFKAVRNVSGLSQSEGAADLAGTESHSVLLSRAASEQEKLAKGGELQSSFSNPGILPRPPVLPGIRPVDREAHSLLDLQNSFSKSVAHRNFNSSITQAAVNLRNNVVTGKKHDFYGVNCFYLHG